QTVAPKQLQPPLVLVTVKRHAANPDGRPPPGESTMPLHDWRDDRGWDSVHLVWLAQLLDWVQPRLPAGYRAYLGSVPALTIDTPNGRPDLSVRQWAAPPAQALGAATSAVEPDQE